MGLKKLQAGGGFLNADAWPAPCWSPCAVSTLVPPVTAAPQAERAWSKGAFPGLYHTRRVLEGLWLLSLPLGAFSPPPVCLDGLGVDGKLIFMAPCLQYPKAMSWGGLQD